QGSGSYATVLGSSDAISTSDLKIVASWATTDRSSGVFYRGGNTSLGGVANVYYSVPFGSGTRPGTYNAPFGYGTGAGAAADQNPTKPESNRNQQFGNYSLIQGTTMKAVPAGLGTGYGVGSGSFGSNAASGYGINTTTPADALFKYSYSASGSYAAGQIDPTQGVLGGNWEKLRAGDTVSVKVIYVPTGQTIFQKDVSVTEG
ncbi:MAG: type IV pilin, partial [Methanoregula sp.]|nr:type IV pilin [Methanoregula sp.]